MKRAKLSIGITAGCILVFGLITVRFENHYGQRRVLLMGYGKCTESSEMAGEYVRTNHYSFGKLHPVQVLWGAIVPPGSPAKPSGDGNIWMCRYHAARWLGKDPITGEDWAWDMPVSLNNP